MHVTPPKGVIQKKVRVQARHKSRLCTWGCACMCGACKPACGRCRGRCLFSAGLLSELPASGWPAWGCCRGECLSCAGFISELPASGWPGAQAASHSTSLQIQAKISRPTDARQRSARISPGSSKVDRRYDRGETLESITVDALFIMPGNFSDTLAETCTAPHCRDTASIAMGAQHLMIDQRWVTHTNHRFDAQQSLAAQNICA